VVESVSSIFGCRYRSYALTILSVLICTQLRAELGTDWIAVATSAPWQTRSNHTSLCYDGKIWVIGGVGSTRYGDVWCSSDGLNWTIRRDWMDPNCPIDFYYRYGHASVVHDERMWLIGGVGRRGELQNDVWYSTNGANWTSATLSAKWTRRQNHTALVHDGKIWVLGGLKSDLLPAVYLHDVWYSSDGMNWTSATVSAPWPSVHTSVSFDGKIWVIGGAGVWFSSDGTSWTLAAIPPWNSPPFSARDGMKAVVCDGRIWAMGGQDFQTIGQNDVWYSSDGRNWTQAAAHAGWRGRVGFGLVVHDRRIWVLGGYSPGLKGTPGVLLNDVWYSAMPTAVPASWQLYP